MPYTPPSGHGTGLDLWNVKFFPLNSSGFINAPGYPIPATTPYEGLELPKPKTLQPNLGAPRTIPVVAQGRVQTTFILPPIDAKTIECHLAYIDLDVFAELSRVKVRTLGGARITVAGTNKQGFEIPGMLIVQQLVGHDETDNDIFTGYVVPRVKASITWPAFNENPIDVTVTMSVGKSKSHFLGLALTEADDGATEASMFPFVSKGLRNIVAWVGDNSETTFLLPADAQAGADFTDTFKMYNMTDAAAVTGTAAADQFVAGAAPGDGDILIGWYEVALEQDNMAKSKLTLETKFAILPKVTFDISSACSDMVGQASEAKYEDKTLGYFAREIYPYLAVLLDPMPSVEEMYAYSPEEIDALFVDIRKKVPNWLDNSDLTEETITLSDGRIITVQSKRPSVLMRYFKAKNEAFSQPAYDNVLREWFRLVRYPKLVGCSIGDVPDQEYARAEMSIDDLYIWESAAKRQVPDWYKSDEEIAADNQAELKEKKSTPASPA